MKKIQSEAEMLKGTLTAAGKKQLERETNRWRLMTRTIRQEMGEETQG